MKSKGELEKRKRANANCECRLLTKVGYSEKQVRALGKTSESNQCTPATRRRRRRRRDSTSPQQIALPARLCSGSVAASCGVRSRQRLERPLPISRCSARRAPCQSAPPPPPRRVFFLFSCGGLARAGSLASPAADASVASALKVMFVPDPRGVCSMSTRGR